MFRALNKGQRGWGRSKAGDGGWVMGSETTVVGWMLCSVCSEGRVSDSGDLSTFSCSWQCRYVDSVAIL